MKPTAEVPTKMKYAPPRLLKYGSLTEMTAAKGGGTKDDNPKGKGGKT
jgi:hypothetical protein